MTAAGLAEAGQRKEEIAMVRTSEQVVVAVAPRTDRGKNASRRLRAAGMVPGNVYGMNLEPYSVAVDPRRIEEILRMGSGRNTIFRLSLGEGKQSRAVMLRELQRDPVREDLVHVDFLRVDETKPVEVSVPVRLLGTAVGVKNEGGVVDFVHRSIEVSCLPNAIPEHFDIDVSDLHLNQHVAVKDIVFAEGIEVLVDPETILAVIAPPRVEEVAPTEAAEPGVEPAEAGEAAPAAPAETEREK